MRPRLSAVGCKRYSTSRFDRDASFRRGVFDAYGNKCAICRLDDPRALRAAHRRGCEANEGDYFGTEHGVCLCANYHRLYDGGTFNIDFDTRRLVEVDSGVCG